MGPRITPHAPGLPCSPQLAVDGQAKELIRAPQRLPHKISINAVVSNLEEPVAEARGPDKPGRYACGQAVSLQETLEVHYWSVELL